MVINADLIKNKMNERQLTARGLAVIVGVSNSTITRIINNETNDMRVSTLLNISKALNIPIGLMIKFNDAEEYINKDIQEYQFDEFKKTYLDDVEQCVNELSQQCKEYKKLASYEPSAQTSYYVGMCNGILLSQDYIYQELYMKHKN